MNFDEIIDNLYPIPRQSKQSLTENVKEVSYPKGHLLLAAGTIETSIYFIKKGIVRAYADTENGQVTFWFGKEGDIILSMKSYVAGQKGYENIELLEECELYRLKSEYLRDLFQTDIHIANFGRTLVEKELVKTEERLISMQFKTALERYEELVNTDSPLLQRVPLGHIASYLGITPVSLSRIRANFRL